MRAGCHIAESDRRSTRIVGGAPPARGGESLGSAHRRLVSVIDRYAARLDQLVVLLLRAVAELNYLEPTYAPAPVDARLLDATGAWRMFEVCLYNRPEDADVCGVLVSASSSAIGPTSLGRSSCWPRAR